MRRRRPHSSRFSSQERRLARAVLPRSSARSRTPRNRRARPVPSSSRPFVRGTRGAWPSWSSASRDQNRASGLARESMRRERARCAGPSLICGRNLRGRAASSGREALLPTTMRDYAFEPLMACAYSRPLYQPQDEHAVCGRTGSWQRGHDARVGGLAFHCARRDRVRDRDFFHFGVSPPVMATFSSSCRLP